MSSRSSFTGEVELNITFHNSPDFYDIECSFRCCFEIHTSSFSSMYAAQYTLIDNVMCRNLQSALIVIQNVVISITMMTSMTGRLDIEAHITLNG